MRRRYEPARRARFWARAAQVAICVLAVSEPLHAQTDYYNTSTGRPLRIEDAVPIEYRGVELDLAPLRFEHRSGSRQWSLHPESTIGILPRTQLQLGIPILYADASPSRSSGVAGLELSVMHALNAETTIPALAMSGEVLLPVGPLGGDAAYGTAKAILTRTLPWARFHINAAYTVGPSDRASRPAGSPAIDGRDLSRWLAGVAVDKTFPLRSLLLSAEAFAEQPIPSEALVAWTGAAGVRYQLAPRWAMDGGLGRRFSGDDRAWYMTLGTAYALGLP